MLSVISTIEAISAWLILQQMLSTISIFSILQFPGNSIAMWVELPGLVCFLFFFFGHLEL